MDVDLLTCDRYSRTLSVQDAFDEINHVAQFQTRPERLHYCPAEFIECEIEDSRTCVIDATNNPGRSFKSISMANYPEDIEIPVIASAGNAALGLSIAAQRENRDIVVFAPRTIMPSKKKMLLSQPNVCLDTTANSFEESIVLARNFTRMNPNARIISGSGLTAIAALSVTLAKDVVRAVSELQQRSAFHDVFISLQVGAGSLATACCVAVHEAILMGDLKPVTPIILAVPTERQKEYFDGLNVTRKGPHATAILSKRDYHYKNCQIDLVDTVIARDIIAPLFPRYNVSDFEPTGLAGIAAIVNERRHSQSNSDAAYVAILSGANGCHEKSTKIGA